MHGMDGIGKGCGTVRYCIGVGSEIRVQVQAKDARWHRRPLKVQL